MSKCGKPGRSQTGTISICMKHVFCSEEGFCDRVLWSCFVCIFLHQSFRNQEGKKVNPLSLMSLLVCGGPSGLWVPPDNEATPVEGLRNCTSETAPPGEKGKLRCQEDVRLCRCHPGTCLGGSISCLGCLGQGRLARLGVGGQEALPLVRGKSNLYASVEETGGQILLGRGMGLLVTHG